ncbi:11454_t:CDS:2, partial [Gigaspora rosea]
VVSKRRGVQKHKKTSRKVGTSTLSLYPFAKNSLKEWIVEQHQRGIAVISNDAKFCITNLLSNEFKLSYPNALNTFKTSDLWFNLFMNQFNLSVRRHLSEKLIEFHNFINELKINNNFELNCIANMDETPVYFDIISAYILDNCGVLADGSKLSLIVIFKGKRVPKGKYPPGIVFFKKCSISNALDNLENHLIESNQTEDKECVIDLIDENKENEVSFATTSVFYINTERSYLIREDETEIIDVLLY